MPHDVRVEDYGIRGVHLALDLLEGYDLLVLVDAMPRRRTARHRHRPRARPGAARREPLDAHRMDPQAVLAMVAELGGEVGRVLVVGCQPADLDEGIGLSPAVAAAVDVAVRVVETSSQKGTPHAPSPSAARSLAGAAVAVREIAPEVRRYLKLREM